MSQLYALPARTNGSALSAAHAGKATAAAARAECSAQRSLAQGSRTVLVLLLRTAPAADDDAEISTDSDGPPPVRASRQVHTQLLASALPRYTYRLEHASVSRALAPSFRTAGAQARGEATTVTQTRTTTGRS